MKSLKPAYGRDYKNSKSVYEALNTGVEFQLTGCLDGGGYVTANELMDAGETKVLVRYNKLKTQGVFGLSREAK